jgi:DNA primase
MSVIDVLLGKIDLRELIEEYTELTPDNKGSYRGSCCLHGGENPTSLFVSDNFYYCYSCASFGNAINFYAEMEGLLFYQSVEALCEKYNINLDGNKEYQTQKSIVKENTILLNKYQKNISKVEEFLIQKRGISKETIAEFQLGFCEDESFLASKKRPNTFFPGIIFPIHCSYGRVISFGKRRTDGDTKPTYVNGYDSDLFKKGDLLYNMHRARKMLKEVKRLHIVEGYVDVISCHDQGLASCGYIGGSLTKNQILVIKEIHSAVKNLMIVVAPDNPNIDETGARELPKIRDKFAKYASNIDVYVPIYPDSCKDFNDCHVQGFKIKDLPLQHIDISVLLLELNKCELQEQEYTLSQSYIQTIKNELIKSNIAEILSKRWNKDLVKVETMLNVKADSKDEKLKKIHSFDSSFDDLKDLLLSEKRGLGFPQIDYTMNSVRNKEILLLAGYSTSGKSTVGLKIVANRIIRYQENVAIFSLEMSRGVVLESIAMEILGVNSYNLEQMIKNDDGLALYEKVKGIVQKHVRIVDESNMDMKKVWEYIDLMNTYEFDEPVRFVMFDHFHLLPDVEDNTIASLNANMIGEIVKHFNLNFLVLGQFNESSQGNIRIGKYKEPSMTDVKGANALKAIAHTIILIWRLYYSQLELSPIDRELVKYITRVKVAKHRRGVRGGIMFDLEYNPDTTKMTERSQLFSLQGGT